MKIFGSAIGLGIAFWLLAEGHGAVAAFLISGYLFNLSQAVSCGLLDLDIREIRRQRSAQEHALSLTLESVAKTAREIAHHRMFS